MKKITIITANDFLVYQPTILNLYDFLKKHFEIEIISFEPVYVGKQKDQTRNITYLKIPFRKAIQNLDYLIFLILRSLKKITGEIKYDYNLSKKIQILILRRGIKKNKRDITIAVDFLSLYLCQQYSSNCHFISLEIYNNDPYKKKIDAAKINSVLIQNQIRYDHLFPGLILKTFYIQNAPVFQKESRKNYSRKDLIWAGSIVKKFAVFDCLKFIKSYPQFKLVLKGGGESKTILQINEEYKKQIENGDIQIDQGYLPAEGFIDFLSHFRIGFCFYDWDLINNNFNYQTAPSGKLFMYLAAGVPVVACNIPGFEFINDFKAGILISDYSPVTIKAAINKIEESYEEYQTGCYKAAEYFSFDKNVEPYIKFLLDE
jgi:glycosyltransferase involved in cell wall biosynthesis